MDILLVRHADAGDAEAFAREGMPDEFRPLSSKGRKQMTPLVRAIKSLLLHIELIAASPYERALETASPLRDHYSKSAYEEISELEPDKSPEQISSWLRLKKISGTVMLVGHEPHLGNFLTWCVGVSRASSLHLKKAGACLVTFDAAPAKGKGCLVWLMGPKELRLVGKRT